MKGEKVNEVVEFDNVTKRFGDTAVLDGMSFSVGKGEIFVIVGPSGIGKSVTLKHIVGLLSPNSGTVRVGTERIGYLFQSGALLAWMTVWDNVALPLRETTHLSEAEIAAKVDAALEAVGLADDGEKHPAEISGGMQKRAGLARSIVCDAELILYDEPTSGLDPVTSLAINRLIVRLNRTRGITSVVVTHDLAAALSFADRLLLIHGGKAVFCGAPHDFLASGNETVRSFVAAMKGEAPTRASARQGEQAESADEGVGVTRNAGDKGSETV